MTWCQTQFDSKSCCVKFPFLRFAFKVRFFGVKLYHPPMKIAPVISLGVPAPPAPALTSQELAGLHFQVGNGGFLKGVGIDVPFLEFVSHHLQVSEISPRVGWCETLGHVPTPVLSHQGYPQIIDSNGTIIGSIPGWFWQLICVHWLVVWNMFCCSIQLGF